MSAYDECYLDSMFQKHRYLFKLIARNCEDAFETITKYMNCDYRYNMDQGNPLFLNKTPKQILSSLGVTVNLSASISEQWRNRKALRTMDREAIEVLEPEWENSFIIWETL